MDGESDDDEKAIEPDWGWRNETGSWEEWCISESSEWYFKGRYTLPVFTAREHAGSVYRP